MSFIISNQTKEFEKPQDNLYKAVCVDLEDLGLCESTYQGELKIQHKIKLTFQLDASNSHGKPFFVSNRYTVSLHPKSSLRKALVAWRGREFTAEEEKAFDIENLLGKPCRLLVANVTSGDKTYTNITAFMPAEKGQVAFTTNYTRRKDREDYQVPEGLLKMRNMMNDGKLPKDEEPPQFDDSDSIPF